MINKKPLALGLSLFITLMILFIYKKMPDFSARSINWANEVSADTINDSWVTWKTNYSNHNPTATYETFMLAVKSGEYKTLSIEEFLTLKVENQRLECYLHAKSAEEAYPPEDRPRHGDDISSVKYFLQTKSPVSPILVARIHKNNSTHYIKLDGVHRLIATAIKKSPIKVLFVNL